MDTVGELEFSSPPVAGSHLFLFPRLFCLTHLRCMPFRSSILSLYGGVIYRPPSASSPAPFLSDFETWLSFFLSTDGPAIILRDFNSHIDDLSQPWPSRLLHLTSSFELQQWDKRSDP
ncbi:hypothetical protein XENTR_v10023124 [Xenopus tropicalis]|nr:hypothetical protein XENTR_v10023124 [Xenopus tropicalis]